MAIATAQQITKYYDLYRDTEITFTRDIIRTLNMDPRQIYIKSSGQQWPCIINSTSFQQARIIIGTKGGAYQLISKDKTASVSLRFCFFMSDNQLLSFYIAGKVTDITPYMNSQDLAIVTLSYTQRPPDDLIEMVGHLIDANINSIRRKDERIIVNEESRRKLAIAKDETLIHVQGVPRRCILRDISFGGAKVVLLGLVQFLKGKDIVLQMEFEDPRETVAIKGTIMNAELVQGRKDIVAVSIKYDEKTIPLTYKIHVNNYITTIRKRVLDGSFTASGEAVNEEKNKEAEKTLPKNSVQPKTEEKQAAAQDVKAEDTVASVMGEKLPELPDF
jgi:hypothetical protein